MTLGSTGSSSTKSPSDGSTCVAGTVLGSDSAETTVTADEIRVREGAVPHGTEWARELGYDVPALNNP